MAKLRHVAMVVKDLDNTAAFYQKVFEMERAFEVKGTVVYLSDGTMNLALIQERPESSSATGGKLGVHHFGFTVEDFKAAEEALTAAGATYAFDLGNPDGMNYERKWNDPEGYLFDISVKGWYGALNEATPETAKTPAKEKADAVS